VSSRSNQHTDAAVAVKAGSRDEGGPTAKEMQAKIGQLALEVDFLEVALGRVGDASAKR
jgi:hypothetical protein